MTLTLEKFYKMGKKSNIGIKMYQHLSHMTWGVYITKNTAYSFQNAGWTRTKWNNEWLILGLQTKNKCIPQSTLYNIKRAILNFLIVLIRHITKQIYQILKWSPRKELRHLKQISIMNIVYTSILYENINSIGKYLL